MTSNMIKLSVEFLVPNTEMWEVMPSVYKVRYFKKTNNEKEASSKPTVTVPQDHVWRQAVFEVPEDQFVTTLYAVSALRYRRSMTVAVQYGEDNCPFH